MLIDTHCHLTYSPLCEHVPSVIERAKKAEVEYLICVGTDLDDSQKCIAIAEKYPQVFATVGIHPNDALNVSPHWEEEMTRLLSHPKVVAVGEIGLDYYWKTTPPAVQADFLRRQIQIAREFDKPVVIHNRQADSDLQTILTKQGYYRGILHCFSSSAEFASAMLRLGLFISFTGSITYGSKKTQSALAAVPLERLLLETDAPFITPVAFKPLPNEPAFLPAIAAEIARLRQIDINDLAFQTSENALKFFNLRP
jgi:TatD DNase family protein